MEVEKEIQFEEKIQELLEKNIKLTEKVLALSKKNYRMLAWQKVIGFLKILLIVVPLILGVIYLPSLVEKVTIFYQDLLGIGNDIKELNPVDKFNTEALDLNSLKPDFLK